MAFIEPMHRNKPNITYLLTQENAFENVVWKMAAILSRPQCVKGLYKWCYACPYERLYEFIQSR